MSLCSCGGGARSISAPPPKPQPATITASGGSGQITAIETGFPDQLVAKVADGNGNPMYGVTVTFTVPPSGPSAILLTGTNTATTDSSGLVESGPLLANGTAGGPYTVSATVQGLAAPADFTLSNTAAPANVRVKSGDWQSTPVKTPFPQRLVVEVLDDGGNPVQAARVTFIVLGHAGADAVFTGGVNTAVSDANGIATSAALSANGVPGRYSIVATADTTAESSNITLTNITGLPAGVAVASGSDETAATNTTFVQPLVAQLVDANSNPVQVLGIPVTFNAPASGASAAFAGAITALTDVNGVAKSPVVWANATAGGPYTVIASSAGLPATANFALTNATPAASNQYVFCTSGLDSYGLNPYTLCGTAIIDANGYVLGGEQDFKDDWQTASPQPTGDRITGGVLAVSAAIGQGTMAIVTNNTALGTDGVEAFGVQFVNAKHARVIQFDGTATSSGSMDFQTIPNALSGSFAFALLGTDATDYPISAGGVFSVSGAMLSGVYDYDDTGTGTAILGSVLTGSISAPDGFGRGSITISSANLPSAINYYFVGPEAVRLVVVGPSHHSGIGSAFGQGASAGQFDNASLGASVFGIESNSNFESTLAAAAGMFTTNPGSGIVQGVAEVDEEGVVTSGASISATYKVAGNGYGNLTIPAGSLQDVSILGIYMVDPGLNINDPNNPTSGLGGALVADLDRYVNGIGFLLPKTDTAASSFSGNYAFCARQFEGTAKNGWELDFLGQGTVSAGELSGVGLLNDFGGFVYQPNMTYSGVRFTGTMTPDPAHPGRYTFGPGGLAYSISIPGILQFNPHFTTVMYQAYGGEVLWLDEDAEDLFFGSLEQQSALTGVPGAR